MLAMNIGGKPPSLRARVIGHFVLGHAWNMDPFGLHSKAADGRGYTQEVWRFLVALWAGTSRRPSAHRVLDGANLFDA